MLPGLLALFIFNYIPMGGIIIAFEDYKISKGILGSEWVGLANFREMFTSIEFLTVLKNTLSISMVKLVFGLVAPVIFALMLNEMKNGRLKKGIQTASYLPHFFSWVILAGIIKNLFSTNGAINSLLLSTGITNEPLAFFASPVLFYWMLILSATWKDIGWSAIIFLSALSGIDPSLYEAATVDGAGRFKRIFYITLPCLFPTIVVVMILNCSHIMNAGFDQIYNLQNPLVYSVSDILDTFNLRKMQSASFSYGTASGLFKSVISLVMMFTTNAISKKLTDSGLW